MSAHATFPAKNSGRVKAWPLFLPRGLLNCKIFLRCGFCVNRRLLPL